MHTHNQESTDRHPFETIWEAHKDDKKLKYILWVAIVVVLLVVLMTVLPFVFNALARVIRSYKDLQCAIQE